ncbi:unnamed protein product [Musa textilis]
MNPRSAAPYPRQAVCPDSAFDCLPLAAFLFPHSTPHTSLAVLQADFGGCLGPLHRSQPRVRMAGGGDIAAATGCCHGRILRSDHLPACGWPFRQKHDSISRTKCLS